MCYVGATLSALLCLYPQVAALLASLAIDPASLPAELPHQAAPPEWSALWENQAAHGRPPEPLVGAEMAAAAARAAAMTGPAAFEDVWQQQQQQRPMSTGWADDFAVQQQMRQGPGGWAEEFKQQQEAAGPQSWASEFEQAQETAATSSAASAAAAADARATSARLVDVLAADGDPKMKNSKFFQFLSKMSKGELTFEDNKV